MRFGFTKEQDEFRASLRRALEARSPTKEVRRLMATDEGFDRDAWRKLNQELGLTAIHIPEAYGGQGFGYAELGIVLEEMGRAVVCAPFFSTAVLASAAILNAGSEEQKKALLPSLADGSKTATLAFSEDGGSNDAAEVATTATPSGATWRLDGAKSFVLDGHTADLIVVLARRPGSRGEEGLSFFTVDGNSAGLERRRLKTMDETRKLARLQFNSVEARLLGEAEEAAEPFARTMQQVLICLANEMVGGAQKVLEMSVEYAKVRVQFGRPIGSFQAIKQQIVEILRHAGTTRSLCFYAGLAAEARPDELPLASAAARFAAEEAADYATRTCIAVHGGIGATWEHDAHLYWRRAQLSRLLLGGVGGAGERVAEEIIARARETRATTTGARA